MHIKQILTFISLVFVAYTSSAHAAYPERPLRLVSPNPAGGANDTIGRIIVQKFSEILGAQVVIDNRGGAGGLIGAEIVARANPDGYTLLFGSSATHTFAPLIYKNIPYDPDRDFIPVTMLAIAQNLLVATPTLPVNNVKELIAHAKAKPRTLNYSSAGVGSNSHVAVEMFVHLAGIRGISTHVPYKGGAMATAATAAGEAHINFGPMPGIIGLVKGGKLKPLAVGGRARSPVLPDVPTAMESGVPAYESAGWFGLMTPAKTPRAIVAQLHDAAVKAVKSPDVSQKLVQMGVDPVTNTPDEFSSYMRQQLASQKKLVQEIGLKSE